MSQRETDQRYLKTQTKLYQALIELLKHQSFDDITVRALCRQAAVSRSGFYLHFVDKYALVDSYEQTLVRRGMQLFYDYRDQGLATMYTQLLTLINDQGALITLLLSRKGSAEIQQRVKTLLRQNAEANILPHYGLKSPSPTAQRYLIALTTGAVLSVLQEWLDTGRQESPAELVGVMRDQVLPIIRQGQFRLS
ncbi:TetR/AcrR family transcriptional regulator [Levilactobacillus acidifarinae]|uniref:Transcriptional regulator n=1 Tax=Levilactobacillus acidifarinae DSM 19394 = JCM 15949 TaxID=1423715 RepID=A0A0R1LFC5_9LACO|nr:TetR/AcrR family transcriptional regulator [Levilactobacillus acidifarinae]KRK94539.1 transcriptional regulator [Levilactobacillus acidifarinae DSM 19394]GEO68288.1 putative transcriptional regulator (TetR/AcrR family) [Levilactobacillus acidifarinae]